jgi:hypothetical protein
MYELIWPLDLEIIKNKYEKIYTRLIKRGKDRGSLSIMYYETHHIIPECFFKNRSRNGKPGKIDGNPNDITNLVNLTPKEHYIAHRLLTKFLTGEALHKMIYALDIMAKSDKNMSRHMIPSRVYEHNIMLIRQIKKGKPLGPQKKKRGPQSPESNEKRRQKLLGRPRLDLRGKPAHNKGNKMSEEQKKKLKGPRAPMSEENKSIRRGKRGPQKNPRVGKPRGPYKKKNIQDDIK